MKKVASFLIVGSIFLGLLAGCGQKGSLYLPAGQRTQAQQA